MATYVPNATQTSEPVASQTVESAALEFRTLKVRTNALETTVASNLVLLQASDAAIVDYVHPYIEAVTAANMLNNLDLGFVFDPVPPTHIFDLGSI